MGLGGIVETLTKAQRTLATVMAGQAVNSPAHRCAWRIGFLANLQGLGENYNPYGNSAFRRYWSDGWKKAATQPRETAKEKGTC